MKNKRLKILFYAIGILTFLALVTWGGVSYSSKPSFCMKCHLMKPSYKSWSINAHKDVQCLNCHADPGIIGYTKVKIHGITQVVQYMTGDYDQKFAVKLNTQNCINCHSGSKKYPKAKDITATTGSRVPAMPHAEILKTKQSCLDCHIGVAHG